MNSIIKTDSFQAFCLVIVFYLMCLPLVGQKTLEVTYIANEGFLLTSGKDKVLIDGIFNNAYGKYHVPSTSVLTQERGALSPFDSLTVLLISHKHADHVNVDYVAEQMVKDLRSRLICPLQVSDMMKPLGNHASIKDRIIARTPAFSARFDTTIRNVGIQVMSFHHPNDPKMEIQDVGFLVTINGFKILHTGDALNDSLDFYKNLNLAKDSIDIAFISRWYFDTEYGDEGTEIMRYLHPKVIIAMHINTDKYTYYRNASNSIQGISPVYFMEVPMSKSIFVKDSLTSVVTDIKNIEQPKSTIHSVQQYSNHVNGQFVLYTGSNSLQTVTFEVFSISGSLVHSERVTCAQKTIIDLKNLSKAIYIVRLHMNGGTIIRKLII